ncbi:hypothetical protein ACCO45_007867 [Purpureocillium lilacinum]|uniref:Uncharacterized protein n=1 Tax=Purpureocillium lilacinum TaxID=33203 RepID=A0ACC4DLV1_PURLI
MSWHPGRPPAASHKTSPLPFLSLTLDEPIRLDGHEVISTTSAPTSDIAKMASRLQ